MKPTTMAYFTPDFLRFFEQLSENNTFEWYEENKEFYDEAVKRPFKELVQEIMDRIKQFEPSLNIPLNDAVFRLHKDIRFSKDKTPFFTYVAANISPAGKKSKECPGFSFQLGPDKIVMGGGVYELDKENLLRVRNHIEDELERFNGIIEDENFKARYGELQGERNKIVPKDLRDLYEEQPYIANKQFFITAELDPKHIFDENLPDLIMEYYHAAKPLNDFLREAIR